MEIDPAPANPTPPDPQRARALCALGQAALDAGAAQEAVRHFREALATDDEDHHAQRGLVRALRAAGRLDQSIVVALRWTVLAPADAVAHEELAASLEAAGRTTQAAKALRRARVVAWRQQLDTSPDDSADDSMDNKPIPNPDAQP